ncbi:MAG TPA: hypothetical protein VMZ91_03235 [Candidatus Paceibacterota bacterium]|nr:hypothetical protein [Candidatus Paceibacterota bacterium]
MEITDLAIKIAKNGPDRVVINEEGDGIPSDRALKKGISPDIIFIRDDNWSLGSTHDLEDIAYNMWNDKWKYFIRLSDGKVKNISEYEGSI